MPERRAYHKFLIGRVKPLQVVGFWIPRVMGLLNSVACAPKRLACALSSAAVVLLAATVSPSFAASVPIVRDAEIERLLFEYARPILAVAGIKGVTEIVLINDPSFNAFVDGRRIYINTGTIMASNTPNEVIGVLAHEIGHLAGGHQERLRQKLESAGKMATIAGLIGMGAAVAGAASGNGEAGQAGAGLAAGSAEAARRSVLAYQRTEEITADRSAVTYLNKTKQSARGMLVTFQRFQSALALSGSRVDPYRISHPLPRERIANLEDLARKSPYFDQSDTAALQARHDMARAKVAAYGGNINTVRRLFRDRPDSIGLKYGEAISAYLQGSSKDALKKLDALAKQMPQNGYLQELRAEILLKSNKPADAAKAYRTALKLDPGKSPTIQVGLGQSLFLSGDSDGAIRELSDALRRDKSNALGYEFLARAYGQSGREADAQLATAQMYFYNGAIKEARLFAARAQQGFKKGSPGWLKAGDIIKAGTKG
jgi:predicted Zn-dependent protease